MNLLYIYIYDVYFLITCTRHMFLHCTFSKEGKAECIHVLACLGVQDRKGVRSRPGSSRRPALYLRGAACNRRPFKTKRHTPGSNCEPKGTRPLLRWSSKWPGFTKRDIQRYKSPSSFTSPAASSCPADWQHLSTAAVRCLEAEWK